MNDRLLKNSLNNAPEVAATVSSRLHQDIMRAVRLAQPSAGKAGFSRAIPALGAAFLALLATGVILLLPAKEAGTPSPPTAQIQPQTQQPVEPVLFLGDRLAGLLKDTSPPEDQLRKELERLKSDLERFDFRS